MERTRLAELIAFDERRMAKHRVIEDRPHPDRPLLPRPRAGASCCTSTTTPTRCWWSWPAGAGPGQRRHRRGRPVRGRARPGRVQARPQEPRPRPGRAAGVRRPPPGLGDPLQPAIEGDHGLPVGQQVVEQFGRLRARGRARAAVEDQGAALEQVGPGVVGRPRPRHPLERVQPTPPGSRRRPWRRSPPARCRWPRRRWPPGPAAGRPGLAWYRPEAV